MKYRITGVDHKSGAERSKTVDAASENGAIEIAKSLGILPTSVKALHSTGTESSPESTAVSAATSPGGHSSKNYKCIQVPPTITTRQDRGNEAARYLEDLINDMWDNGWEFYRIDTIGVRVAPGCLAALFGNPGLTVDYYDVTFHRAHK